MKLRKLLLTENACYKAGQKIKPKGIMVHSTGANNPELRRYIGPDDGLLGKNQYDNHWNRPYPDGRSVCVHAFIGKLADGSIATYQTLPWECRAWHAGGSANNTHIGFEICEDNLTNGAYFRKVYQEAVELCVYLCKEYDLTEKDILCHSEGATKGIASYHGDVMHWFPKHGKSMDDFRADIKALLGGDTEQPAQPAEPETGTTIHRVQVGAFKNRDNAAAYLEKIKAAGFTDAFVTQVGSYHKVQVGAFANRDNAVAYLEKVVRAGFKDAFIAVKTTAPAKKSVEDIARETFLGKYGNGIERKNKLEAMGYDYDEVQAIVNRLQYQ